MSLTPISTSAAWRGDQLSTSDAWVYTLNKAQIEELEALGARFVEENPDLRFVQAAEYPLTETKEAVRAWGKDIDLGRGFTLVRGLRSHLYSDALSSAIFYILGLHIGEPTRQSEMGDIIGHVCATSDKTFADAGALPSKIRDRLGYHRDSSDVVGLMCLRAAKEGGVSCLVSSAEVYNEILRRRPDLAPLLFESYLRDWRGLDPNSPELTYPVPLVDITDGVFSMNGGTRYLRSAQKYPGAPQLSAEQLEMVTLLEDITLEPGMAIEMDFRPGDIQWVSNPTIMHARTEYSDYPEPPRRRHLLRLWLNRDIDRPTGKIDYLKTHLRDQPSDPLTCENPGNFRIDVASVPRVSY